MYKKTPENIELVPFDDVSFDIQMETRNWRNKADIARYFKIPAIDEETHRHWLASLRVDHPKSMAFFIQFDGVFVGVTYFYSISYTDKSADFGIYIANVENRNKGVGTIVLKKMIRYAADVMRFRRLFLDVLASNERAIAVYESCGFAPTGENDGDFYRYVLELS